VSNLNKYQFGWTRSNYDEYANEQSPEDEPLHISWHHADGPHGFGPEVPSDRDYGAVVEEVRDSVTRNRDIPHRKDPKYGYNYSRLAHVQEYEGIQEAADSMNTGNPVRIDNHNLIENLYSKRPNFPRTFPTADRAKYVAELLIKRRDARIPLTPRRRGQ